LYSGLLVSQREYAIFYNNEKTSEYIFNAWDGPNVASTYNIAPIAFSSFGIFANHSSEPNMDVIRALSSKGIIIILKAKKDIN
jgi:hypothetical protein